MTILSIAEAPLDRWLAAARERHSRRSFDGRPLAPATLTALREAVDRWRPSAEARVVMLDEAPEAIYRGIVGGYGRISGAPSALVMIGASDAPPAQASVGYLGEALILEATALDIGTCWVGGFYDSKAVGQHVELASGERVLAISPLGTAQAQVSSAERIVYRAKNPKPRKPVTDIALELGSSTWSVWARAGVEAARIAPSANNRQPWRFRADGGSVVVAFDGPESRIVSKRLDCGIAMLHFELGVRTAGVSGSWELLDHRSDVARFVLGAD